MSIAHTPDQVTDHGTDHVTEHGTGHRTPARRSAPLASARDHLRSVPRPATAPTEGRTSAYPLVPTVVAAPAVTTLAGDVVDHANLDHGASTPALVAVKRAVDTSLRTYSSVHRGNGHLSRVTSRWYEQAREEVASFVGARADDLVVFTRNTTDSLNLLARALPRRTTVFVFASEHHATLLPWDARRTVRLPVPASELDAELLLTEALQRNGSSRNKLVVLTGASNVTGEYWPVERLAAIARDHGARVALDAAQLAPHREVDITALGVDYVAFSGHKVYAPYGAGVLVGRADWLDAAKPYLAGGGATAEVTTGAVRWNTGPARHEGGSPNVIGAIALAAACAAIAGHRTEVEAHEQALATLLEEGLAAIPGVSTLALFGPGSARAATACFTVDGLDSSLVSAALAAEWGIGVRDGKFCAHLLVDELLDDPRRDDAPTTAVRASAGLATTVEHVERLLEAVRSLAQEGPAGDWRLTDAGWVVAGDPREATVEALPRPW